MTTISFQNRVVVITGAGNGLGRTYALDIARRGGAVVVNDLGVDIEGVGGSHAAADKVVAEIKAAGGKAAANYDSVATTDGASRIVKAALDSFGRIDALINNAGNLRTALFENVSQEDRGSLFETHLAGTFNVTQAVWPHMKAQGYGRIVFTTSAAGMLGNPTQSAYGAAKAGITGLMNVLSQEGEPYGILCNGLMPNATGRMGEKTVKDTDPEVMKKKAPFLSALGKSLEPEFTTGMGVYLASESCKTTHSIYSSLGGRMARVFIGITEGWQGSREQPATAEDIAANIVQIRDTAGDFHIPKKLTDEHMVVTKLAPPTRD
ncbi:MAG: SDR family NAD(P)-dependent oxidoreductase [Rhodospirillaceae bacterium]|nr:MAG: SDR family NAD(P)-dependent oxidoreductase [Rhodospirillaceae bacterium]